MVSEERAKRPNSGFFCNVMYRSILQIIQVEGHGSSKKAAKNDAAVGMLAALKKEVTAS